ncbi:MAG: DUF2298 domain-containing protein [Blautia faecis]
MFSKVLAVAVCGYVQWLLACLKISPFTGITCVILTVICCLSSSRNVRTGSRIHFHGNRQPWSTGKRFCFSWCSFSDIFGRIPSSSPWTEKYMDFGFMQAMMRSTLPAQDMWYAGKPFNYYYGGQYLARFYEATEQM